MVKIIKISWLRWLGHLMRMANNPLPCKKNNSVGRPCLRWMDGVTEDLHRMRISNWKDKAGDRRAWRNILQKARTHEEL
jgi:hypothetical protein